MSLLDEIRGSLDDLDEDEARLLIERLLLTQSAMRKAAWDPYPWQVPPAAVPTLGAWLQIGGRGTGKTEGSAHYFDAHMSGPPCDTRLKGGHRAAIVAPSLGDAVESCINGPSGLKAVNPAITFKGGAGGHHARWPNGAEARIFGAYTPQDVERLRAGGNRCLVWMEEAAAMRWLKQALEHTALGLRIGGNPHYVMSTTPKVRPEVKALIDNPRVIVTRGSTRDAHHLAVEVRDVLFGMYEGTRLGRQELDGELLDDIVGTLWTEAMIEAGRMRVFDLERPWQTLAAWLKAAGLAVPPGMLKETRRWRIIMGVDPPGTTAECGIVVIACPVRGRAGVDHAVVLEDASLAGPPEVWGAQAVTTARRWGAEVWVESNQGGDMCRSTIHAVDPKLKVQKITASESKTNRSEPVSTLYGHAIGGEDGPIPAPWIHHVGVHPRLEDQMTTWVAYPEEGVAVKSPDRIDALVHAVRTGLAEMRRPASSVESPLGVLAGAAVYGVAAVAPRARVGPRRPG